MKNIEEILLQKNKPKEALYKAVKHDFRLLPHVIEGMNSPKAAIRYGCGKVLMELSEEYPEKMYPYFDTIVPFLKSKYRIIIWQVLFIIAQLTKVDTKKQFDKIFETYYSFLHDEYMVTVANLVGYSGTIAVAKPYLIPKITDQLLKVESLLTTPHLTEECKRVIAEKAIDSFDMFFDTIEKKDHVLAFVQKQTKSPRRSLQKRARIFLEKRKKF